MIIIDKCAEFIVNTLLDKGYQAYCVGGCIRDQLLGRKVHDWDICTSARPSEVRETFEDLGITVLNTGYKYGTVSVLMSPIDIDIVNQTDTQYHLYEMKSHLYEVTTFRKYSGARKMEYIEYGDTLEEDLKRRDFTMNAIAYNSRDGLVDLVGGAKDIENRIIRAIGDPEERFREDYLRILRMVRFQAQLGFEIDSKAQEAANKLISYVDCTSPERIHSEFVKTLSGDFVKLALLNNKEIIAELFPELGECMGYDQNNPNHRYDIYEHSLKALDILSTQGYCDTNLRIATLFHDIGKPSTARIGADRFTHFHGHSRVSALLVEKILRRLNFSTADITEISDIVKNHDFMPESKSAVKRLINRVGKDTASKIIMLRHCDILSQSNFNIEHKIQALQRFQNWFTEVVEQNEAFQISDLDISGKDLIQLGYKPGIKFGEILYELFNMVVDDEISNTKEQLVEYVLEHFPLS